MGTSKNVVLLLVVDNNISNPLSVSVQKKQFSETRTAFLIPKPPHAADLIAVRLRKTGVVRIWDYVIFCRRFPYFLSILPQSSSPNKIFYIFLIRYDSVLVERAPWLLLHSVRCFYRIRRKICQRTRNPLELFVIRKNISRSFGVVFSNYKMFWYLRSLEQCIESHIGNSSLLSMIYLFPCFWKRELRSFEPTILGCNFQILKIPSSVTESVFRRQY